MDHWFKIKSTTIKLLEENVGKKIFVTLGYKTFLDTTPKAWHIKEEVDKLGINKIKNFCSSKDY